MCLITNYIRSTSVAFTHARVELLIFTSLYIWEDASSGVGTESTIFRRVPSCMGTTFSSLPFGARGADVRLVVGTITIA